MTTCKGCKAEILWVTMRSGKKMPCDPERRAVYVTETPVTTGHPVALVDPEGDVHTGYLATILTTGAREISGYVSHFATCSKATELRRKRA